VLGGLAEQEALHRVSGAFEVRLPITCGGFHLREGRTMSGASAHSCEVGKAEAGVPVWWKVGASIACTDRRCWASALRSA
jgi:hypothetical protein